MALFFLPLSGFPCPLLSTRVICPFHQTHPHSVIKGHLGIISFLNLAFWGDQLFPLSVYIYVYKLLGPGAIQNKPAALHFPMLLFCKMFTHPTSPSYSPTPPPTPSPFTTPHIKTRTNAYTNQLPLSPGCPRLPSVHLREDTQCDPSPPKKRLIKFRCATAFRTTCSYPLSLWLNH